ncbi:MAG: hypothetical protein JXA19_03805 [Anaerolineales bacterium]|nr:hypothetical protein [Anaerolineales bacterium]
MEEHENLDQKKIELPDPNPVTKQRHKQEFAYQILIPLFGFILLLAGLFTVIALSSNASASRSWADISFSFMAIFSLFFGLFPLIILIGLIYLMAKANHGLSPYARLVQDFFKDIENKGKLVADKIASPFIGLGSLQGILELITSKIKKS